AVGMMSTAAIAEALTAGGSSYLLAPAIHGLITDLRTKLQRHLFNVPLRFHDNAKSGELVSRLMNDTEALQNIVSTTTYAGVSEVFYVLISLSYLFYINAGMAALSLVLLACAVIPSYWSLKKLEALFHVRRRATADLTNT